MKWDAHRALIAAFLIVVAVDIWRFIKHPYSPVSGVPIYPPPWTFTAPAIVYGLLSLFGDLVNDEIAAALGIGLAIGVVIGEAQLTAQGDVPVAATVAQLTQSSPNANASQTGVTQLA